MFDILMVFLKQFFKKVDFEKNQQATKKTMKNFSGGKELKRHRQLFSEARDLNFGLRFPKNATGKRLSKV